MGSVSTHSLLLVTAMLATVAPALANAQIRDINETPVASNGDLEEITVTARKRQESVLQVPEIETIIIPAQLENYQITAINDIASLTPGLLFGSYTAEVGTQVSIRGIGTSSFDPGIDQSISLNLDGLSLSQGVAYQSALYDTAQVEVLKGPQALFFGKNSPGGVIALTTNDPGDHFELIGRTSYEFQANESRGEAIISGPVSDTVGLRLSTMYDVYGGFFYNNAEALPATGAVAPEELRFGHTDSLYLRVTAIYKPSDVLKVRLKLNHTSDNNTGGVPFQLTSCPQGLVNYAGVQFYSPNENCRADSHLAITNLNPAAFGGLPGNDGQPFTDVTQDFGSLQVDYDIQPHLTLTSVSGYYYVAAEGFQNGSLAGYAGAPIAVNKDLHRNEFTQELRLNSDFDGPFNVSAGAFYQDGRVTNGVMLEGNTTFGLPPRLQVGSQDVSINSGSVFGQLRYKPVSDLELAGGVRWTDEERSDRAETVDLFGQFSGVPGSEVYPNLPELHTKNWSPELTTTYTPTTDLTVFGSLKQGYKSGSYDLLLPVNPGQNNSFGDEKVQGAELGLKSRLADRQLYANIAAYYYKYDGLQVGVQQVAPSGLPVAITTNAGSAKIYGIDSDLQYRPRLIEGLAVRAAANWNHARFTDFNNAPCWGGQTIAEGCNEIFNSATGLYTAQNLTGLPLVRAPNFQGNLDLDYAMPLSNNMKLKFGAGGQYSSKYLADLGGFRADFYQGAFAKFNARTSVSGANGGWEIAFIANNLGNKLTSGNCANENYAGGLIFPGEITGGPTKGLAGEDEVVCTFDRGRELWLRVTFRPLTLFGRGEGQ